MKVNCKTCGTKVNVKILKKGKSKAAQCSYCGKVAWTNIKDDTIITFFATSNGHGFNAYPDF